MSGADDAFISIMAVEVEQEDSLPKDPDIFTPPTYSRVLNYQSFERNTLQTLPGMKFQALYEFYSKLAH